MKNAVLTDYLYQTDEDTNDKNSISFSTFLSSILQEKFPTFFLENTKLHPHHTQGVSNLTYVVQDRFHKIWIIRARKSNGYRFKKENWILEKYSQKFPAPLPFKNGFGSGHYGTEKISYCIQSYLGFSNATHIEDKKDVSNILVELGQVAKLINSCETIGFGKDFITERGTFSRLTWSEHVDYTLQSLKLKELVDKDYLNVEEANSYEENFLELGLIRPTPKLYHNDFLQNWGNILIDNKNRIQAVIDWEHAASGIGIPEELATAKYTMSRNGDDSEKAKKQMEQILIGYQMSNREYHLDYSKTVDLFVSKIAIEKIWYYEEKIKKQGILPAWQNAFYQNAIQLLKLGAQKLRTESHV